MFFRTAMLFLLSVIVLFAPAPPAGAADNVRIYISQEHAGERRFYTADPQRPAAVYVDGCRLSYDIPALVFSDKYVQGRTMVPLRLTAEFLGAEVKWLGESRSVEVNYDGYTAVLSIAKHQAWAGAKAVFLDIAPTIIRGRTMVPLRFFSEALGSYVLWDNDRWAVFINTSGEEQRIEPLGGLYRDFSILQQREALFYGRAHRYSGLNTFYAPWTAQADAQENGNFARIETAFLALAQAERLAAKSGRNLTDYGIKKIFAQYEDDLPFYVYIYGWQLDFADQYTAYLEQQGKRVSGKERIIKEEVYQQDYLTDSDRYMAVIKFIFDPDQFDTAAPVTLVVEREENTALRFNFNLPTIR